MASELSQLIESELRKAEGANKPDEHQRRLASLRVKVRPARPYYPKRSTVGFKYNWFHRQRLCRQRWRAYAARIDPDPQYLQTGLEKPPPTLLQRVCTTKRQVIAGGVVTLLLVILIIYAAASHRHPTTSPGRCRMSVLELHPAPAFGKFVSSTRCQSVRLQHGADAGSPGQQQLATKAGILGATDDEKLEPGTPDHLLTHTDMTEHSEDTTATSDSANELSSPLPEGDYEVLSEQADDEPEQHQAESQAHKKALNPNLMNTTNYIAPAPSQDMQTAVPVPAPAVSVPAPSVLDTVVASIQNATTATAPAPSS